MLCSAGFGLADTRLAPLAWFLVAAFLVLSAIGIPLTLRFARKFQDRIRAIDAIAEDPEEGPQNEQRKTCCCNSVTLDPP